MKLWVGITDNNWFHFLNGKAPLDEVNFWRPTTPTPYRKDFFPGMPFLFKLHAPDEYIAGGAFSLKFIRLPISLAWAAFGEANGANSLENLRMMIGKLAPLSPGQDRIIGCNPVLVAPRLGQRSFRVLVTDAYNYRCAISRERTLAVLQAAHIRPYAEGGSHELSNGLLLRSDLHTLFDQHYLTIDPNKKTLIVSRRIREQFENGRDYYALNGRELLEPADCLSLPSAENLSYHFARFSTLEG